MASTILLLHYLLFVTGLTTICQSAILKYSTHADSRCGGGWVPYWPEQKCIRYYAVEKKRADAPSFCDNMNQRLVVVRDSDKIDFLIDSRQSSTDAYWIDDEFDSRVWDTYLLISGTAIGRCVRITDMFVPLQRTLCDDEHYFVCQKPKPPRSPCETGWTYMKFVNEEICLKYFIDKKVTYNKAAVECASNGGILALPTSEKKMEAIYWHRVKNMTDDVWVGIHESPITGFLEYENGTYVPGCRMLTVGPHGKTNTMSCDWKISVICEKYMKNPLGGTNCLEGWKQYGASGTPDASCIKYHFDSVDMQTAEFSCRLENAKLISIGTSHTLEYVLQIPYDTRIGFWIQDYYEKPKDWSPLELISGPSLGPCLKVEPRNHTLEWSQCSHRLNYICEKNVDIHGACPPVGWSHFQDGRENVCLIGSKNLYNYRNAAYECGSRGGHLAMPTSQAKYKAIIDALPSHDSSVYIGMYRASLTMALQFADKTKVKSCRMMRREGNAYSISGYESCRLRKGFICQKQYGKEERDIDQDTDK